MERQLCTVVIYVPGAGPAACTGISAMPLSSMNLIKSSNLCGLELCNTLQGYRNYLVTVKHLEENLAKL